MSALDTQVGGNHYKGLPYQPVALNTKLDFNFIQGNIVKYVSRYKNKNGKQDLVKAIHYAQLGQELNPHNFTVLGDSLIKELHNYVEMNGFSEDISKLLMQVVYQDWFEVVVIITNIIKEYD